MTLAVDLRPYADDLPQRMVGVYVAGRLLGSIWPEQGCYAALYRGCWQTLASQAQALDWLLAIDAVWGMFGHEEGCV